MFNLPYKNSERADPDFTQMLILCSLALFISLNIPIRGSFVITWHIFLDIIQTGSINLGQLGLPIIAIILIISSFAAFQTRKRIIGIIIFLGGIYEFVITNIYLRQITWDKSENVSYGAAILFASSAFLVIISLIYIIRPGIKPPRVFWWRPEPRANLFIRIAAVLFTSGVICIQNNFRIVGSVCMITGVALSYYAHKMV